MSPRSRSEWKMQEAPFAASFYKTMSVWPSVALVLCHICKLKCWHNVFTGECNNQFKDFSDFNHKKLKFKLYIKIEKSGWLSDGWNLDLVKLYFTTGFRNPIMRANYDSESQEDQMKRMSDYMICTHLDWEEGQPYEKRLYPGTISFNCYYKQIAKPEVSLEKIKGKVSYFSNYSIHLDRVYGF